MNNSTPSILLYISCWSAMVIGVYTLFEKAEESIKTDARFAISDWLRSFDPLRKIKNFPSLFISTFDSIFNIEGSHAPSFLRSSIASCVSLIVLILFWGILHTDQFLNYFLGVVDSDTDVFIKLLLMIFPFLIGCFLNLFPDYLSLWKTRFIIGLLQTKPIYLSVPLFLTDLFITSILALGPLYLFFSLAGSDFNNITLLIKLNVLPLSAPISTSEFLGKMTYGIFFYSTFFTFIWAFLFMAIGLLSLRINLFEAP